MTTEQGHMRLTRNSANWRATAVNILCGLALAFVTAAALSPTPAQARWNDDWPLRKKITLDTSATGANIADPIGTVTAVIRLQDENFHFDQAKDDLSDLRFISGDDKTEFKFHIEKWDNVLHEAFIWVAIPNVAPGSKSEIWLYYGNKKAEPKSDPKGTYDSDTALVYHFDDRAPAQDSSQGGNDAQGVGKTTDGEIGSSLSLDGRTALTLPASPSLAQAAGAPFTWSAWVKPGAPAPKAAIYSRRDGANAFVIGLDNGLPYVEVTNGGVSQQSGGGAPVDAGKWSHLAVVADSKITVYLDGKAYATLNASLPALNAQAVIGGPAASGAAGFIGAIDEVKIAKVARPSGFVAFAAIEEGSGKDKLVSYSVDEEASSFSLGYFGIILRSVTLDGWIVISLLAIMAVVSWYVMYDKVVYINRQAKANEAFMKGFRQLTTDLASLDHGDPDDLSTVDARISEEEAQMMDRSSLYRVYHIGAAEIRHRFTGNGGTATVLSVESIAAIRAALDGGFVKETQALNRLMVLLTIAISGGPFLGLLGTVVGVMITFAAIAASGDVNVNAIAPGIAAALVATVAGLGVAIPSLFAYNYLTIRIKDLTSDLRVFIDEFVAKMAEFYSADRLAKRASTAHSRSAAE